MKEESGERIQEIIDHVDEYLYENEYEMTDGIHAITVIMLGTCRKVGISKPHLLSYISNMWEANDPDSDYHRSRESSTRVRY
jgi:hypothetical protein